MSFMLNRLTGCRPIILMWGTRLTPVLWSVVLVDVYNYPCCRIVHLRHSCGFNFQVQVRPWYIADSYHCLDASKPVDPRKAVFVGGVPRPLKASELAEVMTLKYGNVALIMIDSDCDLKYPKGNCNHSGTAW